MLFSYWRRLTPSASQGMKERFIHTFDLFFYAVTQQAADRRAGVIPDINSYITLRRDTSGCKPCWALIEYANDLDIPDDVMEHEVLETLGEAANDLVTWSNVSLLLLQRFYVYKLVSQPRPFLGHLLIQCRAVSRRHAQYDRHCYAHRRPITSRGRRPCR